MQSTTLTHAKLRLSESNVRKANGDTGLEALAASIAEHGLLQPLIVSPSAGKKTLYDVHAGGRRWRAIGLLIERGVLPKDYAIDVRLCENEDAAAREISLAENLIREAMTLADEARAYRDIVDGGADAEAVARRFVPHNATTAAWPISCSGRQSDRLFMPHFRAFVSGNPGAHQAGIELALPNRLFSLLRWVSTSNPSRVTAMVCSNWADNFPSAVTTVQPSSLVTVLWVPWLIIGSMVNTMPSRKAKPLPGLPKWRTCGSSCISRPMPWPQ